LAARLDTVDPGLGVEDMILALYAAEPLEPEQVGLPSLSPLLKTPLPQLGRRGDGAPEIAPLLDRIGARLGLDALSRIEERESHIPERAAVYVAAEKNLHPNPPPLAGEGGRRQSVPFPSPAGGGGAGWGYASAKPPRPVRLFAPPEPVEAAWLLPDDPPFHFTWRRRAHRVRRADGPERIAEEWWAAEGQCGAAAIRDYYRVEDEEGRRFWLFRAGLPGEPPPRWFVHGIFA
jgi:protein ImuB